MPLKSQKNPTRTKCCVEGCATRICSGVPMHGFPRVDKYPELYQHWVDAIRMNNGTPFWIPRKSNRVCAFHFETVENCQIRVPTVFPNIDNQAPSTSGEQAYEDDDDEDLVAGDGEEDPMDAYEASLAANSIMPGDDSTSCGDEENTPAYDGSIDEDSAMTYEDIEERYNNIVSDVVSTLVTDDDIMDEDTNVTDNEDDAAQMHYEALDQSTTTYCNGEEIEDIAKQENIEEEIIYDDNIFEDGEDSTIPTQIFSSEQLGLNQEELRDDEYCVVVVKPGSDEPKLESAEKAAPSKSPIRNESASKTPATEKHTGKKTGKKVEPTKPAGKMITVKPEKTLPSSLEPSAGEQSDESAALPETILALSEEVKQRLLSEETLPSKNGVVELQEQEESVKKERVKSPTKKPKIEIGSKEKTPTKKSPVKLNQKTSPGKCKEKEISPLKKPPIEREPQGKTEGKEKEISPVEQKKKENEKETTPTVGEKEETAKEKPLVEQEVRKTSRNESKEKKTSESVSVKSEGLKIDGLLLDGEPIKLKDCSVNIVKTPANAKSIKKASEPKVKNVVEKKETAQSGSKERDSRKNEEIVAGSSSDFLNALSLKSSQEEESGGSGLRRSARIRAGAGKRRKFGTSSSWSVAFKDPPKKKLKIETDESSQSSESVPYDFEDEDDPDIGASDLGDSDTTTTSGSDISSVNETKLKRNPQSKPNGVAARKHDQGRAPSATTEGVKKAKFHGYERVRLGDQATQVGLPGKCDGFIFDVSRDDPRNVGVSCNVFYNYQPKKCKTHLSTWTRRKKKPDSLTIKNCVKNRKSTDGSHSAEATKMHAQKAANSKPNVKTPSGSMQSKNSSDNTEHLIEVVDNTDVWETVNLDDSKERENSTYTETVYTIGEIKVEPGMVVAPSVDKLDGEPQKMGDINAAELPDVDVKKEEDCDDWQDGEMIGFDRTTCTVTELCGVSQGGAESAGAMESSVRNTLSKPGDKSTELIDTDDLTRPEHPTELSSSIEHIDENPIDNETHPDEEAMGTDGVSPRDPVTDSFEKTETTTECHSGANASRKTESPDEDGNLETSTDNTAPPNMLSGDVCSDLENEAVPLLEGGKSAVKEGSECGRESVASSGVLEKVSTADSAVPAESPHEAEMSGSEKDAENVDKHDSNTSADGVNSVDCSSELPLATSLKPVEVEVSCDSREDGSAERSGDSNGVQVGTSLVERLNAAADKEMSAEPAPDAAPPTAPAPGAAPPTAPAPGAAPPTAPAQGAAGPTVPAPGAAPPTAPAPDAAPPNGRTGPKTLTDSKASDSITGHRGREAECQDDIGKPGSGKDQDEAVERPNSPDFSSDSSNDSLIDVPIPDINDSDGGEPDVVFSGSSVETPFAKPPFPRCLLDTRGGTTADNLPRHTEFRAENLSAEDASNAECHPPNKLNLDFGKGGVAESPTPQSVRPENTVPCESTRVFDDIERDLEKMFDMDR